MAASFISNVGKACLAPNLGFIRMATGVRLGIMPGYPTTLAELAGFAPRVRNAGMAFPGAGRLVASLVTLPTHGRVSERDLRALEQWIGGR